MDVVQVGGCSGGRIFLKYSYTPSRFFDLTRKNPNRNSE